MARPANPEQLAFGRLLQKPGDLLGPRMKISMRRYFLDLRFERAEIFRFLLEQQIRRADRAKMRAHDSRLASAGFFNPLEKLHELAFDLIGFSGQYVKTQSR